VSFLIFVLADVLFPNRMQLEMALHTLHAEQNMDELQFWGKINGKFSILWENEAVTPHIFFKQIFDFISFLSRYQR